ncbi:PocR ligand-binding domain-containing protein [Lachnoclostridium sp. An169]|uniref:PocR ligand-binding domain-containing protein n=1 Tax=Lachnoclostridium sp. An169 TaxID=1965569 RepID=UPI0013A619AE|nr:PocR ligand-binding domain-containing protein [Lachnoclostridium sp. An169]
MISTFNLQKLGDLLKDFYTLTRIRITVFDETFRELAACPEEVAPFCQVIRTDPEAARRCRLCDTLACQTASQRRSPYTYQCHAGLTESIVPLYTGNILIGYLLFGHVFSYQSHEDGWEIISRRCRNYNIDMDALKDACFERPLIPKDYITSATHIMQAVASYLCMERMAYLRQESLPVRIDEYISRHFTGDMDIETLCEHFQIGRTRLYEIARENYGMGIAEHIRRLRIEKAKVLLEEEPRMSVAQIASECGFGDYNYFITVFKKLTGYAPGAYRRRNGDK